MHGKRFMKNNLSVHTFVTLWPLLSPGLPQKLPSFFCIPSLSSSSSNSWYL
jgi:hypothetical protein